MIEETSFNRLPGVGCTHLSGVWPVALRFSCRWSSTRLRRRRRLRPNLRPLLCMATQASSALSPSYCLGSSVGTRRRRCVSAECGSGWPCRSCNRATNHGNRSGRTRSLRPNLGMSRDASRPSRSPRGTPPAIPSIWDRPGVGSGGRPMRRPAIRPR